MKKRFQLIFCFHFVIHVLCMLFVQASQPSAQKYQSYLREKLSYDKFFVPESDVTAVFLSCSNQTSLKIAVQSFLFFNTYPLKRLWVLHCDEKDNPQRKKQLANALPLDSRNYADYITLKMIDRQQNHSLIAALSSTLSEINSKYVYLSDTTWQTRKGYGFIEEAKNIFQDSSISVKISQIVTTYPYWRIIARLQPLQWAKTGQSFHQIRAFNPDSFHYLSLNPSLINKQVLFDKTFSKNLANICTLNACDSSKLIQFDRCCIWALGQYLHQQNYTQIFLNDGTSIPNVVHIK